MPSEGVLHRVEAQVARTDRPARSTDVESVESVEFDEFDEFDEFVAAYSAALFRYAFLLTADEDEARDLLQEALLKTYLAWDRIRWVEHPASYVRRILVTTRTSIWRRQRRRVREVPLVADDRGAAATDHYGPADDRSVMWQLIRRLPQRQRAVLVLVYYESLTEAEVAAVLRCSTGTVKSQKSKAIAKLRHWMAQSEEEIR